MGANKFSPKVFLLEPRFESGAWAGCWAGAGLVWVEEIEIGLWELLGCLGLRDSCMEPGSVVSPGGSGGGWGGTRRRNRDVRPNLLSVPTCSQSIRAARRSSWSRSPLVRTTSEASIIMVETRVEDRLAFRHQRSHERDQEMSPSSGYHLSLFAMGSGQPWRHRVADWDTLLRMGSEGFEPHGFSALSWLLLLARPLATRT